MGISSIFVALSALVAGGALAVPVAEPVSFDIQNENVTLFDLARRAESINYNQDYIASGANVQYSPNQGAGSFSINYNTQADFVVGLGWQPGDAK
jgi:endo-1,4-beta-xylanase